MSRILLYEWCTLLVLGAGKTTTFSILTGDFAMSSGTAAIAGYDIRTHLRKVSTYLYSFNIHTVHVKFLIQVQQRIGYCPQVCIHNVMLTSYP